MSTLANESILETLYDEALDELANRLSNLSEDELADKAAKIAHKRFAEMY